MNFKEVKIALPMLLFTMIVTVESGFLTGGGGGGGGSSCSSDCLKFRDPICEVYCTKAPAMKGKQMTGGVYNDDPRVCVCLGPQTEEVPWKDVSAFINGEQLKSIECRLVIATQTVGGADKGAFLMHDDKVQCFLPGRRPSHPSDFANVKGDTKTKEDECGTACNRGDKAATDRHAAHFAVRDADDPAANHEPYICECFKVTINNKKMPPTAKNIIRNYGKL